MVADALADVDGLDLAVVAEQARPSPTRSAAPTPRSSRRWPRSRATPPPGDQPRGVRLLRDRYGFEVVGTVIPSGTTLAEPSSAELSELVEVVEAEGVPRSSPTPHRPPTWPMCSPTRPVGASRWSSCSESLGDEGSGGETYLELIRTNAIGSCPLWPEVGADVVHC